MSLNVVLCLLGYCLLALHGKDDAGAKVLARMSSMPLESYDSLQPLPGLPEDRVHVDQRQSRGVSEAKVHYSSCIDGNSEPTISTGCYLAVSVCAHVV
eukprot:538896-Amphidinium_carterae.1